MGTLLWASVTVWVKNILSLIHKEGYLRITKQGVPAEKPLKSAETLSFIHLNLRKIIFKPLISAGLKAKEESLVALSLTLQNH